MRSTKPGSLQCGKIVFILFFDQLIIRFVCHELDVTSVDIIAYVIFLQSRYGLLCVYVLKVLFKMFCENVLQQSRYLLFYFVTSRFLSIFYSIKKLFYEAIRCFHRLICCMLMKLYVLITLPRFDYRGDDVTIICCGVHFKTINYSFHALL